MTTRGRIEAGFTSWGRFVIRRRWWVIVACVALTGVLVCRLGELRVDNSDAAFLHSDDPERIRYNRFKEQFDREDRIMVLLHPGGEVFDFDFLEWLRVLHRDIENEVPYVEEVTSLINARNTRGDGDELIVEDLMEDWPKDDAELAALRSRALGNPLYIDALLTKDARYTVLSIKPFTYSSRAPDSDALAGFDDARSKLDDLLGQVNNLKEAFSQLGSDELHRLACDALIAVRSDDWQDCLIELLPTFPLATCDRTASRLVEAGRSKHDFEEPVQRILTSPVKHYEALLWLWDGPSCNEAADCVIPRNILTRVLRMLEDVRISEKLSREKERVLRSRVRAVLSARKYDRFRRCLDTIDMGVMRALRTQVSRAEGLAVSVRGDMLKELDRRLPAEAGAAPEKPWEREEVLYVTETGLVRKQNQIEHHVNVTMHKNAQAIGRAAERGDLSENSEYKFALEERDLLRARLAQMNEEVARSKILKPEEVPTDGIGVGSQVIFRRVDDGREYVMMFSGPWEANIEQGWFNYKAPLSQGLMGKTVGEVVEFSHTGAEGRYEIVALDSIFSDDAPAMPAQTSQAERQSAKSPS